MDRNGRRTAEYPQLSIPSCPSSISIHPFSSATRRRFSPNCAFCAAINRMMSSNPGLRSLQSLLLFPTRGDISCKNFDLKLRWSFRNSTSDNRQHELAPYVDGWMSVCTSCNPWIARVANRHPSTSCSPMGLPYLEYGANSCSTRRNYDGAFATPHQTTDNLSVVSAVCSIKEWTEEGSISQKTVLTVLHKLLLLPIQFTDGNTK